MGFVVLLLGAQAFRDTFGGVVARGETSASSGRAPASLGPLIAVEPRNLLPSKADTSASLMEWNWNCGDPQRGETQVAASLLRFKGRACGVPDFGDDKVTLTNETNGFEASIFSKGKSAYETDLIQLREGPNRIRLEYVNSAGRRIESFFTVISKISATSAQ